MLQEACVSRRFLCRFNAAIYLNCISKIDLLKIYFVKIASENIKDLFQIYFCTLRRLLLKIYLWTTNIFDANIFMEGIFRCKYIYEKYILLLQDCS
jgi:hypothetical protein